MACDYCIGLIFMFVICGIISFSLYKKYNEEGNKFTGYMCAFFAFNSIGALIWLLASEWVFNVEESYVNLVYTLEDFHVPEIVVTVMFLMFRNLAIIQEEFHRILDAQYNRGYNKPNYFSFTYLTLLGNIIGGTLYRGLRNSENIADILLSRNFNRKFPHEPLHWTLTGVVWICVSICYIIFIVYMTSGVMM